MSLPNHVSPIVKVYYGKPILPEVSRVLACLYEKDFKLVAFKDVDSMPIDLIRLQASTSVPAPFFEDGSKFLFESRAICRYVSETYANRGNRYLLGHDLLDRVSIEQWLKSEEQSFDPPSRALVLQLAFPLSTKSSNDLREESERLAKVLDVYNHRLGESQYLAGDEFTLADLTHLPNSQYIATSHEWGHLFYERENLNRWWEDVSTRPSWSQVVEEIERSKEEGYQEEMTEEEETNYFENIFQPIEEPEPEKSKSTLKINQNVAGPRGSVSVTIPEKRGISMSVSDIKTKNPAADAEVTIQGSTIPPIRTKITPTTPHSDKATTETTRVEYQATKQETHDKVTIEGTTIPPTPTRTQIPPTASRIDKDSTDAIRVESRSTKQDTHDKVTTKRPTTSTHTQIPPTSPHTDKANTETTRVESQSTKQDTHDKVTIEGPTIPPTRTQIPPTAPHIHKASTETIKVESQSTKEDTHDKVTTEGPTTPPTRTQIPPTAPHTDKASTETTKVESQSTKQETHDKFTTEGHTTPPTRTQIPPTTHRTDKTSTETTIVESQSTKQDTNDKVTTEGTTIRPTHTQIPPTASRTDKASTETTRVESQSTKQEAHDKVTTEGPTISPTRTQIPPTAPRTDKDSTKTTRVESQSIKPVTDAKVKVEKTLFPPTSKEVPPTHETTTKSPKATQKDTASLTNETILSKSHGLLFRQPSPPTSKTVQPESQPPEGTQAPSTEKTTPEPPVKYQGQTSVADSKQGHAGEKLTGKRDETEIKADAFLAGKHKDWHEQYHQIEEVTTEETTISSTSTQMPPTASRTNKASTETTRVESQSTKQDTHDKVTTEGPTTPPTRTQTPPTAPRTD